MPVLPHEIWILLPIVLAAYTAQTLTGFGASLIAVTLGAHFMDIDRLVPVLIPLTVAATGMIAWQERKHIDFGLLVRQVFPLMGAGLVAGLLVYEMLRGMTPKWLLGLIVVVFAVRQLWLHVQEKAGDFALSPVMTGLFLIMAGIAQAFYTTGGPFITYAFMGKQMSKKVFRATLCAVWCSFNLVLIGVFLINGRITMDSFKITAPLFAVLPLAFFLGDRLHNLVSEKFFQIITCILLILSGFPLLLGSC
ncbi:MAG: sulfite exporter TauE/SafE family protein [Desulfatibacillum sp.]|nr:sulfite exporter TauE/SafE family protein [Desulfatibacillum sp.]